MGNVHSIARSNDFWVKNLGEFQEGVRLYRCGENDLPLRYIYHDYKRRSKLSKINLSTERFEQYFYKEGNGEDCIDLFEYIKEHIAEGSLCKLHIVEYEHGSDMEITKCTITSKGIEEVDVISGMD